MFGDGFIPGSRASMILDCLVVALFFIGVMQAFSVMLVKVFRRYQAHKILQIVISAIMVLLILFFEVEVRLSGWRDRAVDSPYYGTMLTTYLVGHIAIAVVYLLLWFLTMRSALRRFSDPARPGTFSASHKRQAWGAVCAMAGTVFSGWLFYYLAFVA